MKVEFLIPAFLSAVLLASGQASFAATEDDGENLEVSESKFNDSDLLIETLSADDAQDVEDAQTTLDGLQEELTSTQEELQTLQNSDSASEEEIQALEEKVNTLEGEVEQAISNLSTAEQTLEDETSAISAQVEQLSDEQITALNQKLNNAVSSNLLVDIDSEDLQAVIDGDYNFQQISMFTKAYEEEAKFTSLADKFAAKADEKDNDMFLRQADRMSEKSQIQKDSFISKIDRFNSKDQLKAEFKNVAKQAAKDAAKNEAKNNAKHSAKDAAKQAAKDAAKQIAKAAAKQAAKNQAKEDAKDNAKNVAKQIIKEEVCSSVFFGVRLDSNKH
ncbi:hypothetical protein Q9L42_003410 [Methylomarinum sp. Ch1-1]|uniref:Uncharacterized protein n=1 Tax=Methylomarinum roseum TaxID=3067653 RepID=A0AAU7NW90_9GAMM|nr:hypothetical protein [Methylomarinum sp. Ch1-1]MDP4522764.1 hypothetical protein [Methylomarinum sp. Ch1-1]